MYIDSHCHLSFPELYGELDAILAAMKKEGVQGALCICTTMDEFERIHQIASDYTNIWCTVGVHPDTEEDFSPSLAYLLEMGSRMRVIGVGETGVDYYRLEGRTLAEMQWQRERFRIHIRAARILAKPLIIHTRSASKDTLSILQEEGENGSSGSAGGVFHCFAENLEVAKAALDLGFYISFSGIVTFKNALEIKEVAKFIPLERMLIETDSPYLAPTPHRGKTNNPSYVPLVAQHIAILKNLPVEKIASVTTQNFYDLFRVSYETVV